MKYSDYRFGTKQFTLTIVMMLCSIVGIYLPAFVALIPFVVSAAMFMLIILDAFKQGHEAAKIE